MVGKRGLGYWQRQNEAPYTMDDDAVDILELNILLGKSVVCLKEHVDDCIEKSGKLVEQEVE